MARLNSHMMVSFDYIIKYIVYMPDCSVAESNGDRMTKWTLVKRLILRDGCSLSSALRGTTAELCIAILKITKNFIGLRRRIDSSDDLWKKSFLKADGLKILFSLIDKIKLNTFAEVVLHLECTLCIDAIFTYDVSFQHVNELGGSTLFNLDGKLESL